MSAERVWAAVIGRADDRLLGWLRARDIPIANFHDVHDGMIAKNLAVQAFLSSGADTLLMIDGDQIPTDATRILDEQACPLAYCGYASRTVSGRGHFGDGDFGAGCFRVSREALLAIDRRLEEINALFPGSTNPIIQAVQVGWFFRPVRCQGTDEFRCPCEWFHSLARAAGYRARMLGTIGHATSTTDVLLLEEGYCSFATGTEFREEPTHGSPPPES